MNWKVRQKQETVREKPQQSEVEGNGERIPSITKHRNVHSIMPRQRQYSLTVEREQTESLRYFRMDMGLSDVRIIFRGNDIYVSPSQIRRFNLKTGDIIKGISVSKHRERNSVPCYM